MTRSAYSVGSFEGLLLVARFAATRARPKTAVPVFEYAGYENGGEVSLVLKRSYTAQRDRETEADW